MPRTQSFVDFMFTYVDNIECKIGKRADNIKIEDEIGFRHTHESID